MKKNLSLYFSFFLFLCLSAKSQVDPHFSEYYTYPSWLNPALTGVIDGDYRVSSIYRNQWSGIGNGFSTVGLSGEYVTDKKINIGGSIMQQTAGDGGFTYLTANASIAYTGIRFGKLGYQRISVGLQAGLLQRRINPSKFQLGDQWNPITGYNSGASTSEIFTKTSASTFDAGAGAVYFDADPNKKANVYVGLSVFHLTQPKDPFTSGSFQQTLPVRYTLHGGLKLTLSDVVSLTPNFLYVRQGTAEEKMMGAYAQLKANETTDVLVGANYRINDAIAPYAGLYYKRFLVGVSYDINNSDLTKSINSTNSFEISISYTGLRTKKYATEHFICPRL